VFVGLEKVLERARFVYACGETPDATEAYDMRRGLIPTLGPAAYEAGGPLPAAAPFVIMTVANLLCCDWWCRKGRNRKSATIR